MKEILDFLALLKQNNNREWFNENKHLYENAKNRFEEFVNILIPSVKEFDRTINVNSAKECTYRIYNDVRFSKNKEPYKTHMGAYISNGGKKSKFAGYYFHLEDEGSFAGGGIYCPQPKILKTIRDDIFHDSKTIKQILNNKDFKNTFPKMYGDKLKTAPRGFPKDYKDIKLLNYKNYIVFSNLSNKDILADSFFENLLNIFKMQKPFNDYLNKIVK